MRLYFESIGTKALSCLPAGHELFKVSWKSLWSQNKVLVCLLLPALKYVAKPSKPKRQGTIFSIVRWAYNFQWTVRSIPFSSQTHYFYVLSAVCSRKPNRDKPKPEWQAVADKDKNPLQTEIQSGFFKQGHRICKTFLSAHFLMKIWEISLSLP